MSIPAIQCGNLRVGSTTLWPAPVGLWPSHNTNPRRQLRGKFVTRARGFAGWNETWMNVFRVECVWRAGIFWEGGSMKNGVFMLCACYEQYRPPRLPFHVLRRTSLKSGVFCTVHYTPHTTHHTPSNNTHTHFTHPTLTYDLYGGVHATTYVRHHRSQAVPPFIHSHITPAHHFGLFVSLACQSPS